MQKETNLNQKQKDKTKFYFAKEFSDEDNVHTKTPFEEAETLDNFELIDDEDIMDTVFHINQKDNLLDDEEE